MVRSNGAKKTRFSLLYILVLLTAGIEAKNSGTRLNGVNAASLERSTSGVLRPHRSPEAEKYEGNFKIFRGDFIHCNDFDVIEVSIRYLISCSISVNPGPLILRLVLLLFLVGIVHMLASFSRYYIRAVAIDM